MKKIAVLLVLVLSLGAMGVASAGGDKGNACPKNSQNPQGTPPSCGKQPGKGAPTPEDCQEKGFVSSRVRPLEELDPTGGHAGNPNDGGVVHFVNCGIIENVLNF